MAKPKIDDLVNIRFGILTAISFSHTNDRRRSYWMCVCDCGNTCIKPRDDLLKGRYISCGCANNKKVEIGNEDFIRFYKLWEEIRVKNDVPKVWKDSFLKFKGDVYEDFIQLGDSDMAIDSILKYTKKEPEYRDVYGVGYSTSKDFHCENRKSYSTWHKMIERCYKDNNNYDSYADCYVCKDWHDFNVFNKWFEENYYELSNGERVHLDKDILVKDNKFYSPQRCIFVPQSINQIFQRHVKKANGNPTGVSKSGKNSYIAVMSDNLTKKRVRSIPTESIEQAYEYYINMKRDYIMRVASHYEHEVPNKLHKRLIELSKTFVEGW